MPRSGYVLFLSLLLTFQSIAQSKNDFAPVLLTPSSGQLSSSQILLSDQPSLNMTREVELWIGSTPVAVSTNAESLVLPLVVSNVPGRLVFRDLWGSVIPIESGLKTRALSRNFTTTGVPLKLKPSLISGNVRLEAEGGWKNSVTRLQWSDDLKTWQDVPVVTGMTSSVSLAVDAAMPGRFFRATIPTPEPPTILLAKSTENRVKLLWKGSGESFRIEFSTNRPGMTTTPGVSIETNLASPAVIRGLLPATTYFFRIQALGPGGVSSWSSVMESTTAAVPVQNDGRRKLLIFGSSVASGIGDPTGKGWAGRLKDSVGTNWLVINRSIPGDSTKSLLDRFDRDVAGENWDVIWVALSLMNEGILGPNPDAVYESYTQNQRKLVGLIRQLGAVPVVSSAYPNSWYGPEETGYCRRFNCLLNDWGVAGVDFFGSLDDGNGRWLPGFSSDALHPNAAGHETMFRSIPSGLLDSLLVADPAPEDTCSSIKLAPTATNSAPICFTPGAAVSDFTISFWFNGMNLAGKALCGIGSSASRVRAPDGALRYTSFNGSEVVAESKQASDGNWHHLALVHQSGLSKTTFYIDGQSLGTVSERFASVEKFTLGGRADGNAWANATGVSFWGFNVHRVPLPAETIDIIAAGKTWKLSADLSAPVSKLAQLSALTANSHPSIRGRIQIDPASWIQEASCPGLLP